MSAHPNRSRATILVIEDDEGSRHLVTYLLESAGHRVLAAENGALGLGLALAESPDLILCDLQMPVMNGYEVAQSLRSHHTWRVVPLVAVTAFDGPEDRARALGVGFDEHLAKSISSEALVQQVEAFLGPAFRAAPRGA